MSTGNDLDKAIRDALVAWIENKAADYAAISESLWRDGKRTKAKWYGSTAGSLRADAANLRDGRTTPPVSSQDTPAPRQPRAWTEDDVEPYPRPKVVTTPDGRERIYAEDWGGWVLRNEIGGSVDQWDDLPKPITEVLPESPSTQGGER